MESNLLPINQDLNSAVRISIARCTVEVSSGLHGLLSVCGHSNNIKKKVVQAIFVRAYETFYSAVLMIQMRAGATVGLHSRSLLECVADIIGFAEEDKYLETWIGQEKRQWEIIAQEYLKFREAGTISSESDYWESMSKTRLTDIRKFCEANNLAFENLQSAAGREKILSCHVPDRALDYRFLCLDAHSRPTSVIGQHAPEGFVEGFVPTNTALLEYYLIAMLEALAAAAVAARKIWAGDAATEKATEAIVVSVNAMYAAIEKENPRVRLESVS